MKVEYHQQHMRAHPEVRMRLNHATGAIFRIRCLMATSKCKNISPEVKEAMMATLSMYDMHMHYRTLETHHEALTYPPYGFEHRLDEHHCSAIIFRIYSF
ncbi:hypothetical protein D8674_037534 [Pyrus ussuriensis x Pyrus communis]|uniref:Uncharacterized protein n=1 Tax=Pyrus ussuriensis x Pyrus communis TaxID=2448454 RepID=A0A5N5GMJ9_9ROSA|nr:hypothetical protein D8674_037534 [Pyrus ussuriensis x Pyrus communis]